MYGAIDDLRLVGGIKGHGRRRLKLLLGAGLVGVERLLLVMHVGLLIHGAVLAVRRYTVWLRIVRRIGILRHISIVHVLGGVGRVLLLVVMLLLMVVWRLMPLMSAPMWSAWGRRHGNWPSVGTRSAGDVEASLTSVARTTLHGWLPSRQAVGHLAGLGGDESQCRSLLRETQDDEASPKVLRRY